MEQITENVLDQEKRTLPKDIFHPKEEIMIGKVKNYILDLIFKWLKKNDIDLDKVEDVYLIGSSAGYNYNDTSDIDVSLRTTISDDWIRTNWAMLPNGNLLPNTKHPVNFYLTTKTYHQNDIEDADACYSLLKDKWIKKEDKSKQEIPYNYALEVAKFFASGFDDRLNEFYRDKIELERYKKLSVKEDEITQEEINERVAQKELELKADMDSLIIADKLAHSFRKEAFDGKTSEILLDIKITKKNSSINNVVYKLLEMFGYFEKLKQVKKDFDDIFKT